MLIWPPSMTSDLGSRLAYTAAKARHRLRHRHRGAPLVVFSMAKTGSSSVAAALRDEGAEVVHHVHDLDPAFLAEEEEAYKWSGRPWRNWDAQALLRRPPTPADPWRVVSMVRDPIAQSVSAFFQPGGRLGYVHPGARVDDLRARFADRLDRLPLHWFESHLQPTLGIDVYATPFDPAAGYQIITTPTVRLLLLRCEDLARAPDALADLLGGPPTLSVPALNRGAEKGYAELYRSFTSTLRPTTAQLDTAYGSRLARHFYAPEEIDGFRALWSRRGQPPDENGDRDR
jgi:hypothetical protein